MVEELCSSVSSCNLCIWTSFTCLHHHHVSFLPLQGQWRIVGWFCSCANACLLNSKVSDELWDVSAVLPMLAFWTWRLVMNCGRMILQLCKCLVAELTFVRMNCGMTILQSCKCLLAELNSCCRVGSCVFDEFQLFHHLCHTWTQFGILLQASQQQAQ